MGRGPRAWIGGGRNRPGRRSARPFKVDTSHYLKYNSRLNAIADVAQMAERLICNQQVAGSTPAVSSRQHQLGVLEAGAGRTGIGRDYCMGGPGSSAPQDCLARRVGDCPRRTVGQGRTRLERAQESREMLVRVVGCPSGQREQTVNLPADAYEGSNPSPTILFALTSARRQSVPRRCAERKV